MSIIMPNIHRIIFKIFGIQYYTHLCCSTKEVKGGILGDGIPCEWHHHSGHVWSVGGGEGRATRRSQKHVAIESAIPQYRGRKFDCCFPMWMPLQLHIM